MAQTAMKGFGNAAQDLLVAQRGEKMRKEMFKATQREKDRMAEETASYRLDRASDKFSSSSNAVEMALTQATVGLVSKEEFMRRKQEIEGTGNAAEEAGEGAAAAAVEGEKKKKKKKKEAKSILSFEEEGDEEGDAAEVVHKKPKKNPSVVSYEIRKDEPAPAPLQPAKPKAQLEVKPLPPGYTCIKTVAGGGIELALEVMATQSAPATKINGMCSHSISMVVQATERNNEANNVLCSFLKTVLGGEAICEVTRGHRAPVKTVAVRNYSGLPGAEIVDAVYSQLHASWKA